MIKQIEVDRVYSSQHWYIGNICRHIYGDNNSGGPLNQFCLQLLIARETEHILVLGNKIQNKINAKSL